MEKKLNKLLKQALAPTLEPPFRLNQQIIRQIKTQEGANCTRPLTDLNARRNAQKGTTMYRKKKNLPAAILTAATVLCLSSATVLAAWKHFSPSDVAEKLNDTALSNAFLNGQALLIDETQSLGGFDVTLLGIISGENLSDFSHYSGDVPDTDRTYAVIAIANSDGTSMPDTSDPAYGKQEFFVSPLIQGYDPAFYNIVSMNGSYAEISEDGILYRLAECDNIEYFSGQELYLCVSDGSFYDKKLYRYDRATGIISRNEEYSGLNALFRLPLNPEKSNPEKAAAYIQSLGLTIPGDSSEPAVPVKADSIEIQGNSEQGIAVAEYALQFSGTPYQWGGVSLTEGTDCSGFVMSVYEYFGVSLPHSASLDCSEGYAVESLKDAEPGDLICYAEPSHVAIYLGGGQIIHASPTFGVCVTNVEYVENAKITAIRRLLPPSPNPAASR